MKRVNSLFFALLFAISFLLKKTSIGAPATTACINNLIPETPGKTPNYWCTWAAQNYIWGQGATSMNNQLLFGGAGLETGRANLNEQEIFKPNGWASLFSKVRSDLIFVVDDGYYPKNDMTALQLNPLKFPSYFDIDPAKNLEKFNNDLKKAGWRGLGLWTRRVAEPDQAATERLAWSHAADILYWKVDTGDNGSKYSELAKQAHLGLIIENSIAAGPFNHGPNNRAATNYGSSRLDMLKHDDVVRIYDRDQPLSLPTSIDRVAALLETAAGQPDAKAIINCEDEVYLGAALGCSVGIFRSPYIGLRPSGDMDIYMGGPRHPKQRMDEVTRAIRWHRIAPPYSANITPFATDTEVLSDSWKCSLGDSWDMSANDKVATQTAPARVARGIPLPEVTAAEDKPWVLASRHQNGAVSVAALGRITPEKGYFIPQADVEIQAGDMPPALGVFGRYRSLTFIFSQSIPIKSKILAQDLAGDTAVDISTKVTIQNNRLTIPGSVIDQIGLSAATKGDLSDPGLVIVIK